MKNKSLLTGIGGSLLILSSNAMFTPVAVATVDLFDLYVTASATIKSCDDNEVTGRAYLYELPSTEGVKQVRVNLFVKGLSPGKHAVHIHETGACKPSCGDAGGHFDPGPNSNPSPDGNHPFHTGDLVNINVGPNGDGFLTTKTSRITLSAGPLSINDHDGSAFIIHVDPDTYCPHGEEAGCAGGGRAACGVITVHDEPQNDT